MKQFITIFCLFILSANYGWSQYGEIDTIISFPGESFITDLIKSDVDGDNDEDFLFSTWNNNKTYLLKNNFPFDEIDTTLLLLNGPDSYEFAEINNDGFIDIVYKNENDSLSVLLNDGNGNFNNTLENITPATNGKFVDTDGDGDDDYVYVEWVQHVVDSLIEANGWISYTYTLEYHLLKKENAGIDLISSPDTLFTELLTDSTFTDSYFENFLDLGGVASFEVEEAIENENGSVFVFISRKIHIADNYSGLNPAQIQDLLLIEKAANDSVTTYVGHQSDSHFGGSKFWEQIYIGNAFPNGKPDAILRIRDHTDFGPFYEDLYLNVFDGQPNDFTGPNFPTLEGNWDTSFWIEEFPPKQIANFVSFNNDDLGDMIEYHNYYNDIHLYLHKQVSPYEFSNKEYFASIENINYITDCFIDEDDKKDLLMTQYSYYSDTSYLIWMRNLGDNYTICTEDIVLSSQAEVDSFVYNYNCTEIIGDLWIGKPGSFGEPDELSDITNLQGLSSIQHIEGNLDINNNGVLSSLLGLNNLSFVGGHFNMKYNENLQSISALTNLTNIGTLMDWEEGFGQGISIENNDNLYTLYGLSNVDNFNQSINISNNLDLIQIGAFKNLSTLKYLTLNNNGLTYINAFQDLIEVASLSITNHPDLTNLNSFDNLNMIYSEHFNSSDIIGECYIANNASLDNLDGLSNLCFIEGPLTISNNASLTQIDGLNNISDIGIWSNALQILNGPLSIVHITDNPLLASCCAVNNIPDLYGFEPHIIENNAPNCNSLEEVETICGPPDYSNGCATTFSAKVLLEGCYSSGEMTANLNSIIPMSQPFNTAPYNYTGSETLNSIPENMVDWVLIEARLGTPSLSGTPNQTVIEQKAGILLSNGSIIAPDGTSAPRFQNLLADAEYYFVIRHKNHLDIMTANPFSPKSLIQVDFRFYDFNAFGNQQLKQMFSNGVTNIYAMHAGDANGDGIIQVSDYDLWFANNAVVNTYSNTDFNLDGIIQTTDYDKWFVNKAKVGIVEIQY